MKQGLLQEVQFRKRETRKGMNSEKKKKRESARTQDAQKIHRAQFLSDLHEFQSIAGIAFRHWCFTHQKPTTPHTALETH